MKTYTKEEKRKEQFVRYDLRQMLRNMGIGIDDVYYKTDGGLEIVTLMYKNGSERTVNVTADSLLALTRDVLNKI